MIHELLDLLRHILDDPGRTRRLVSLIIVIAVVGTAAPDIGDLVTMLRLTR